MFITISSLRMTPAPRSDYRGVGAGGRHKAALVHLHSVGSLNRSHDFTAEGRGSSLAPLGRRSFTDVIFDFKRQVESIVLVQADGDELDYIIGNFSVSVRNDAKLLIWFGDDAKFIVD